MAVKVYFQRYHLCRWK